MDPALHVIQRQVRAGAEILDLCIDAQGRATVVEVKWERLMRNTVAHGLDYAACIEQRPSRR